MDSGSTTVGGIVIPSTDPAFLGVVVGIHIPLGIACVVVGAITMLSRKGRGRHSRFGTIYSWCVLALFVSATFLSIMRWYEKLPPVHFGGGLVRVRVVRSLGASTSLAELDQAPHSGDEPVLRRHVDRVLRR